MGFAGIGEEAAPRASRVDNVCVPAGSSRVVPANVRRAGAGVVTVNVPFSKTSLTGPFAVGTVPFTVRNGPKFGAMRIFAKPGSSGVTPKT